MKKIVAIAVASLALCALPSVALASGGSTCAQYSTVCSVKSITKSRTPSHSTVLSATANRSDTTEKASAGTLPFTGLDIGFLAAGGVILLGAGLLVRRLSSQS